MKRGKSSLTEKRTSSVFTPEFKNQLVRLYENKKLRADTIHEHDLTASSFGKLVKQIQSSGSFKE